MVWTWESGANSVVHYRFEWGDDKAARNQRKHGVAFEEARSCFLDVFAIEAFDPDHSEDEDRFMMIGASKRGRLLVVAFTLRDHETIRIVSAREAMRRERRHYEEQLNTP